LQRFVAYIREEQNDSCPLRLLFDNAHDARQTKKSYPYHLIIENERTATVILLLTNQAINRLLFKSLSDLFGSERPDAV
jgi:hypothetical protein